VLGFTPTLGQSGVVTTKVHPWGVKFILVNSKIQNCTFTNFHLCVKKEKWVLKTYFAIRGWWFLDVTLEELEMKR